MIVRAARLAALIEPAREYETFMLIVSSVDNPSTLPARNKIVLYSAVPRGLKAVLRQR